MARGGDVLGERIVRDGGVEVGDASRAAPVDEEHGGALLFLHGGLDLADVDPDAGFALHGALGAEKRLRLDSGPEPLQYRERQYDRDETYLQHHLPPPLLSVVPAGRCVCPPAAHR